MDDEGTVYDFRNGQAAGIKCRIGISLVSQERRQVPGVLRMRCICWIKMVSGFCKIIRTVPVFVNMHSVKFSAVSVFFIIGKSPDFRFN